MNLYLVKRNDYVDYDEYNSAVVAAESPEEAVQILKDKYSSKYLLGWGKWDVTVTLIAPTEPGIIHESFRAG